MRLPEENEPHPTHTPHLPWAEMAPEGRGWKENELYSTTGAGRALEGKLPSHAEIPGEGGRGGGCV